jgi:hypothetical protein
MASFLIKQRFLYFLSGISTAVQFTVVTNSVHTSCTVSQFSRNQCPTSVTMLVTMYFNTNLTVFFKTSGHNTSMCDVAEDLYKWSDMENITTWPTHRRQKGKLKVVLYIPWGQRGGLHSVSTWMLDERKRSLSHSGHFTSPGENPLTQWSGDGGHTCCQVVFVDEKISSDQDSNSGWSAHNLVTTLPPTPTHRKQKFTPKPELSPLRQVNW